MKVWMDENDESAASLRRINEERCNPHRPTVHHVGIQWQPACSCGCDQAGDALHDDWADALDEARTNLMRAVHGPADDPTDPQGVRV